MTSATLDRDVESGSDDVGRQPVTKGGGALLMIVKVTWPSFITLVANASTDV